MRNLAANFRDRLDIEVLSGGMIAPTTPTPISSMAGYIQTAYKTVEERTGIVFGEDFLWHIFNPDKSDWYPDSLKPAIAMCIFKEIYPDEQVMFASDLQYALNHEGRDLTDNEAYRHLLDKYAIDHDNFFEKLSSPGYAEPARYEFALIKQLGVSGFPTVFIQASTSKFYLAVRGYTDFETANRQIESILQEIEKVNV